MMVLATKNPLNILSTMGIFAVQLLVLGGRKNPRALHCNVARILGADLKEVSLGHNPLVNDDISICYRNTYHHFGRDFSSNSSTSSLFLSLSLLFFSWRGRLQVLRYVIHFPFRLYYHALTRAVHETTQHFHPSFSRSNHPILITIDIPFVRHRCCFSLGP